eukprot:TRINITY_DN3108_c0_g1_i9.p3 TRINITY_DN3108_c0_g1~~TRINITY_DN3108_c0_g1_i9.p3  ORF type:complete len:209 (-),score=-18.76 TRINITY_DN3108_c0_g1_i9:582-1208(-)
MSMQYVRVFLNTYIWLVFYIQFFINYVTQICRLKLGFVRYQYCKQIQKQSTCNKRFSKKRQCYCVLKILILLHTKQPQGLTHIDTMHFVNLYYKYNTHCDIVLYSFIKFSQIEYTLRYCVVFIYNILIVSLEVVFNKIYCEMWLQQQQRRFKAESFQQFFFCFSLFFPYCISHQGAPPKNGQFGKKKPFRPSFFERGGGGALTWINTV